MININYITVKQQMEFIARIGIRITQFKFGISPRPYILKIQQISLFNGMTTARPFLVIFYCISSIRQAATYFLCLTKNWIQLEIK